MSGFSTPSPYLLGLEAKAKQLQAIADAWNGTTDVNFLRLEIRERWPNLAALLDALGDNDA